MHSFNISTFWFSQWHTYVTVVVVVAALLPPSNIVDIGRAMSGQREEGWKSAPSIMHFPRIPFYYLLLLFFVPQKMALTIRPYFRSR